MNKVVSGADEAIRDISDGMTLMLGGFGLCLFWRKSCVQGGAELTCGPDRPFPFHPSKA
ncbi:hypothetical protein ACRQ5D_18440 [Mucilaginibacter sp. P25]|uniref:Uncharacterized protein n=1 Tax=Mucilaginibacter gossypii TaxID=551996 RepID=A0A1G7S267_9SPHI|nr:hypothetical protein SAMN05192573_102430 [Mucilaginibacter gossypii]